jgi:3-hydroxyisobutyrate dehydrogenase-like beta-hydroxyacid dehydrogenase
VRVGVVGLGRMGVPIAHRLLDAGHDVTVFNRTPGREAGFVERGAAAAASTREIWDRADVCITIVKDDEALAAVTIGPGGLLAEPPPGRTLVDMSTVSLEASRALAEAAQQAGVDYLRAPVSGNPSVVEAGNLTIMVSGDEAVLRRHEQLLRDVGPKVFQLGPGEEARTMKLVLQVMIAGTAELIAEGLVLGERHGLDRAQLLEVMGESAVGSPFVRYKTAALVAGDYSPTFSAALMLKDVGLVLSAAREAGVPLPLTALLEELFKSCVAEGIGELDLMALVPRLEREAPS